MDAKDTTECILCSILYSPLLSVIFGCSDKLSNYNWIKGINLVEKGIYIWSFIVELTHFDSFIVYIFFGGCFGIIDDGQMNFED